MKTKGFSEFRDGERERRPKQESGTMVTATYSKRRLCEYYQSLANDPEYEFTEYVTGPDGEQVPVKSQPGKSFRDNFASQAKSIWGLDEADATGKMGSAEFSKKFIESMVDLSTAADACYLGDRNKLKLPRTDPKQSGITISLTDADRKVTPIRDIANGQSQLTDKVSVTEPHIRGRIENNTKHLKHQETK